MSIWTVTYCATRVDKTMFALQKRQESAAGELAYFLLISLSLSHPCILRSEEGKEKKKGGGRETALSRK